MDVPDTQMVVITLTIAATASLLIERVLEALKHIIENVGADTASPLKANIERLKKSVKLASILRDSFNKSEKSLEKFADVFDDSVKKKLLDIETNNAESTAPALVCIDPDEEMQDDNYENNAFIALKSLSPINDEEQGWRKLQLFYHLFGLGLGVIFASVMDLHLLATLFLKAQHSSVMLMFWDEILTGLVIAGGSQPIHILIRFITTRQAPPELNKVFEDESEESKVAAGENEANIQTTSAMSLVAPGQLDTFTWEQIKYMGGVKPESLETRNRRNGNPNLIVFHHTAMSSNLGFQAIVDEFLINKGWSTGYHCVIMPDGVIKPFCRWDRVGNHCKGLNNRSLGVSFHGNFHTEDNDNFSNANGRFGNKAPTREQLHAGARLIALWTHLYDDIQLDFEKSILAHGQAKPGQTACPGSNFPIAELQDQVKHFYQDWEQSSFAKSQLNQFKMRPYLYI